MQAGTEKTAKRNAAGRPDTTTHIHGCYGCSQYEDGCQDKGETEKGDLEHYTKPDYTTLLHYTIAHYYTTLAGGLRPEPLMAVNRRTTLDNVVAVALRNQIDQVLPNVGGPDDVGARGGGRGRGRGRVRGRGGAPRRPRNTEGDELDNGRILCRICRRDYTVGRFGK